ncbi:MAG: radical SAM protein [Sandaracinaceae bacterium]
MKKRNASLLPVASRDEREDPMIRELERRLARPQRHRLLQGYPMAPLSTPLEGPRDPLADLVDDPDRALLVGVMPHTFCTPKVEGCGFCTFPHERYAGALLRRSVDAVEREIDATLARHPWLAERRVEAVYFGGGTANLLPPDQLDRLLAALGRGFDLAQSELSLEGVPRFFAVRRFALLDVLERAPVRHRRISMGVQTFDPSWIERMGRDAFGDRAEVERLVIEAHRRGLTASADLLFNLPGATVDHALDDVRQAIELGLDQVCVYNLVLTADLDTRWAREPSLVARMPSPEVALVTWLAVREALLGAGYVQTTLTNFERVDVARTARRFVYEAASFDPARHDAIGFGPGGISTFTYDDPRGGGARLARKWMNAGLSSAFADAIEADEPAASSVFDYSPRDLRLLHVTRNLSGLGIDRDRYAAFFGTELEADYAAPLGAAMDRGLLVEVGRRIEPTPPGMFYADAVAGSFAAARVSELRGEGDPNVATRHHMG